MSEEKRHDEHARPKDKDVLGFLQVEIANTAN